MAVLSLNTNVPSLLAQRQLGRVTKELHSTFQALSSGLRVNRASDDAAGLAIASQLKVDARVYTQGIRNVNDGVSLLSIAEGAVSELSNIVIRIRELATEAANGTLAVKQRRALNLEADELVEEFNRIVQSTAFNNRRLIDGSFGTLTVQAGYGLLGGIPCTIGNELDHGVGDGTLQTAVSYGTDGTLHDIHSRDLNGDGHEDLAVTVHSGTCVDVLLGNGDGTFRARTSFAMQPGQGARSVNSADLNADGVVDLVATSYTAGVAVFLGNGDGSFRTRVTYSTGVDPWAVLPFDLTADGVIDLVIPDYGSNTIGVFVGNGNGTFRARRSYSANTTPHDATLVDLDGNGLVDVATADYGGDAVCVLFGLGNGVFSSPTSFAAGNGPVTINSADFNRDGYYDVVTADNNATTASVFLGNGDGSFRARLTYQTGSVASDAVPWDLTGDGFIDLVTANQLNNVVSVHIGNGDGTFRARTSFATGLTPFALAVSDFNEDGAYDIATADNGASNTTTVLLSPASEITAVPYLNISNREEALNPIYSPGPARGPGSLPLERP